MIDTRGLCGTLTLTEVNNTDAYIVYEFEGSGVTYSSNVITVNVANTFAAPIVSIGTEGLDGTNVCASFELYRCKNLSPTTPSGGVVVSTGSDTDLSTKANIVVTGSSTTFTGTSYIQTTQVVGATTGTENALVSVPIADAEGIVVEYVVRKTNGTTASRTGTILGAYDGTTVQYTDSSTRDAGSGSTAGITFRVARVGSNLNLGYTITSDTFTITVYVRALGTYTSGT